ncbi:MAG: hypothetical protein AAF571_03525 [Verrucomicrobiota bacterium]
MRRPSAVIFLVSLITALSSLWADEASPAQAWDQAEQIFHEAAQEDAGSVAAVAQYSDAALRFESSAKDHYRPGSAWYNAGNAWFEAGELGRAIAAYLHARIYRPFDANVHESLKSARALRVERVPGDSWNRLTQWPLRWVQALFVSLFIVLVFTLLLHLRYRESWSLVSMIILAGMQSVGLCLLLYTYWQQGNQAVLIADAIESRKGPGYHYQAAFNQELSSGMEFEVMDTRREWCRIALRDGRECWIPERMLTRIDTAR